MPATGQAETIQEVSGHGSFLQLRTNQRVSGALVVSGVTQFHAAQCLC